MGIISMIALAAAELLKKYGFETAKWIAQRAFLLALALGVGPIVLFKGFSLITRYMMNYSSSYIGGQGLQPVTVQLIGVGVGSPHKLSYRSQCRFSCPSVCCPLCFGQ